MDIRVMRAQMEAAYVGGTLKGLQSSANTVLKFALQSLKETLEGVQPEEGQPLNYAIKAMPKEWKEAVSEMASLCSTLELITRLVPGHETGRRTYPQDGLTKDEYYIVHAVNYELTKLY